MRGPLELDTCREFVVPRLKAAGWADDQILAQYRITDGRVIAVGSRHRRAAPLIADYVLEYRPGVPVAVIEAKREYATPGKGMQQAKRYGERLDVPFAYATNGIGIVEDDRMTGLENDRLTGFPGPEQLWTRYRQWKGLDELAAAGIEVPFNRQVRTSDGAVKEPRYYQRVAVNRAVGAVLRGDKRLLLTLATGSGKTFVALQIVAKLWSSGWRADRNPRVLYLADRNVLVNDPINREFVPAFGEGPLWKLTRGEAKAGREIYFGIYQALADSGDDPNGIFRQFPVDFFDLVIVDECHRGSASSQSAWRRILDHFAPATQIGLTATPRREGTTDTYEYFGNPLYEYSLAQGIDDGFLAPYRVRRVVLSPDAHGWSPSPGEVDRFRREIPSGLYTTPQFERVVSLLSRTEAAARHLTNHLHATDRFAKTVIFCVDQEHADQMRRAMHNANADLTPQYPDYAVRIVSDEHTIGQGHLTSFTDLHKVTPVVVTTSEMLSTGVDMPPVRNIVLFRPIGSISLFKQIIGRGTRLCPDVDKLTFDIIDYTGATSLFADPEFDGPPEAVETVQLDDDGNEVTDPEAEEPEPEFGDEPPEDGVDPDELSHPPRKFYVDDTEVWVTAEAAYHLDPETQRLRLVEYRDHVATSVRALFPDPTLLRTRWGSRVGRQDVLDSLERRGIDAAELNERLGLPVDADALDALVHLAWNLPLRTRTERARRVRQNHRAFFDEFQPAAREVLAELLDVYTRHGVSELDDLRVLQVPPLSELGSPAELANRFGSPAELRAAVGRLGDLLYAS